MIWAAIINSRPVRFIGAALVALAGLLAWGAAKKREGAAEARSDAAAKDAADFAETIRKVTHETASDDPADAVRSRLRDRAKRKP